ncbi:acyltransferase family protein [Polymorphobacter sp.]|uniref:acyltransferase family protein n=1 Tax=Polymorphobacter sp. TaxID=1909290 RepID=UPI003F6E8B24
MTDSGVAVPLGNARPASVPDNAAVGAHRAQRPAFVPNLQVVRFIAALLVVIEHLQFKTRDRGILESGWLVDFKPIYFPVGIDMFFVVSGFIMYHLSRDRFGEPGYWREFLRRRLIRIVPLYWLFTALILLAMLGFSNQMNHADFDVRHVAASFVFFPWPRADGNIVPVLSSGWTLNYEFVFYLVFAAALTLHRRRGEMFVVAALVVLTASHWLVPPDWPALEFWTSSIVLDFLLGVGLAKLHGGGLRLSPAAALALLVVGVSGLVASHQFQALYTLGRFVALGVPAALVCAAFVLLPPPANPGRVYRTMLAGGDASYSLYLSHGFTLTLFAIAWQRVGVSSPYLFFMAAIVVSVVVAWLIYTHVELRMMAWLNRRITARSVQRVKGT